MNWIIPKDQISIAFYYIAIHNHNFVDLLLQEQGTN